MHCFLLKFRKIPRTNKAIAADGWSQAEVRWEAWNDDLLRF